MYDIIIIGAGIAGLNSARLLKEKYPDKKMCILEKTNRIGGLVDTRFYNVSQKKRTLGQNKTQKIRKKRIKYEAGGAVVYEYQKNMLELINKFNIEMREIPLGKNKRHFKNYYDGKKRKHPLQKETTEKYMTLLKKVFAFMDTKTDDYCRKYTLEQMCLQVLSFDETRFIEFCYGYASEFRVGNSVVTRKNMENELLNSNKMFIFTKGYHTLIQAIYNSIKEDVELFKNSEIMSFYKAKDIYVLKMRNGSTYKTKQLVFAVPKEGLLKLCNSFEEKELEMFNSVESFSLSRIFAKYDMTKPENKWIHKFKHSTINNPIRQIIPVSKKHGFMQISYSDWYFADYWGTLDEKKIKPILRKLLQENLHYDKIIDPVYLKRVYWKNAVHYWNVNVNEKNMYKKIMHMRKNLFIVGESFSLNQCWCEGPVQTSIDLLKIM